MMGKGIGGGGKALREKDRGGRGGGGRGGDGEGRE